MKARSDPKRWREDPEIGWERFCSKCKEWWPADREFWTISPVPGTLRSRFHAYCKACNVQRKRERRARGGE